MVVLFGCGYDVWVFFFFVCSRLLVLNRRLLFCFQRAIFCVEFGPSGYLFASSFCSGCLMFLVAEVIFYILFFFGSLKWFFCFPLSSYFHFPMEFVFSLPCGVRIFEHESLFIFSMKSFVSCWGKKWNH